MSAFNFYLFIYFLIILSSYLICSPFNEDEIMCAGPWQPKPILHQT